MSEKRSREFRANMALSETCLWLEALAEDSDSVDELEGLAATLNEQLDWFLSESSMPVPQIARKTLKALERRHKELVGS